MTAYLLRGDARALPVADRSVDLIVTSPPYFGLRSYQDGGVHYGGQLGSEATPAEFVDALIACTAEMVRVLKPSGSIFINLGDKYSSAGRTGATSGTNPKNTGGGNFRVDDGCRPKSLLGLPWRYTLRCTDDLGLILRAEIIWSKPNGPPESVTDRVRRSHEQWFHLVTQPRYYTAIDKIREPHLHGGVGLAWQERKDLGEPMRHGNTGGGASQGAPEQKAGNPLGKMPGSVWSIPSQPLTVPAHLGVDHYAAFPMEWPRQFVLGFSPRGVCTACGQGRRPVTEGTPMIIAPSARRLGAQASGNANRTSTSGTMLAPATRTITGEACACPDTSAPTTPGVVLDPFSGTGTTALVADVLGRQGVGVDMSADYNRLAAWRTTDPGQRAAAMQVDKPERVADGQLGLFE